MSCEVWQCDVCGLRLLPCEVVDMLCEGCRDAIEAEDAMEEHMAPEEIDDDWEDSGRDGAADRELEDGDDLDPCDCGNPDCPGSVDGECMFDYQGP